MARRDVTRGEEGRGRRGLQSREGRDRMLAVLGGGATRPSGSLDHGSFDHAPFDHASFDHASFDHASFDHASFDHAFV